MASALEWPPPAAPMTPEDLAAHQDRVTEVKIIGSWTWPADHPTEFYIAFRAPDGEVLEISMEDMRPDEDWSAFAVGQLNAMRRRRAEALRLGVPVGCHLSMAGPPQ